MKKNWEITGSLDFIVRQAVLETLHETNYNLTHSARKLRVGRNTMYRWLDAFDIDIERYRAAASGRPYVAKTTQIADEPIDAPKVRSRLIIRDGKLSLEYLSATA